MSADPADRQLHLLIGGTAVGKSALALRLAERLGAEILSVDSMQVYRRMDIGTAKPSADERRRVPHHLIDAAEPSEAYSVARFVADAERAMADVHDRGRSVLAVAGTPLYLMGLLYGLFDGPSAAGGLRAEIRDEAARLGPAAMHAELARVDQTAADRIHPNDLRRIERALEVFRLTGRPISAQQRQWDAPPRRSYRAVGLRRSREDQSRRINERVRQMVKAGLLDEVRGLLAEPAPLSEQARQAVGYAELIAHLAGAMGFDEAIEAIKVNTRRLAKSQRTWFRRIPQVAWVDLAEAEESTDALDRALANLGAS